MSDPRIVLLDIESLPDLNAALNVWPQLSSYPGQTLKASINSIACFGWKILGESEVHCENAWDYPLWSSDVNNDKDLCVRIQEVLEGADCIVTHNGRRFDQKFIQTRFIYHGMTPLPKIHHVDTCAEVKKNLFLFNNRLNTVAKFLTDTEKMDHEGWDLWVKVHRRDPSAMQTMAEYCKKDVLVLEEVFKRLRPVIASLPNYNLFSPASEKVCPNCGSTRLKSEGKRHTSSASYRRYCCQDCRTWSRTDLKDDLPRKV